MRLPAALAQHSERVSGAARIPACVEPYSRNGRNGRYYFQPGDTYQRVHVRRAGRYHCAARGCGSLRMRLARCTHGREAEAVRMLRSPRATCFAPSRVGVGQAHLYI